MSEVLFRCPFCGSTETPKLIVRGSGCGIPASRTNVGIADQSGTSTIRTAWRLMHPVSCLLSPVS